MRNSEVSDDMNSRYINTKYVTDEQQFTCKAPRNDQEQFPDRGPGRPDQNPVRKTAG